MKKVIGLLAAFMLLGSVGAFAAGKKKGIKPNQTRLAKQDSRKNRWALTLPPQPFTCAAVDAMILKFILQL